MGLGGWLVLVGLGILLSPFKIAFQAFFPLYPAYANGSLAAVTTPGNVAYDPLWAPILLGEFCYNFGLVIAWIYIAYLFFGKRTQFPRHYIILLVTTATFILLDAVAIKLVLPDEPIFDPDTVKNLAQAIFATLIWGPYMRVSKRVRNTFVH